MNESTRKTAAWFLVLALVVGTVGASHHGVLCISQDGAAKVEKACLPCCPDNDVDSGSAAVMPVESSHVGCDDCTDHELAGLIRHLRWRSGDEPDSPSTGPSVSEPLPFVVPWAAISSSGHAEVCLPHLYDSPGPPATSLSSVILIC